MSLRLGSLEVFTQPCPHFVIDGLFDDGFYRELVDAIPEFVGFDRTDPAATGTLSIPELRRFSGHHEALGDELQRDLLILNDRVSELYRQLLDRLPDDPAYEEFSRLVGQAEWEQPDYFRLRERGNGFALPPHMDGPYFLGTHLIYLARDIDDVANGTMLFTPKLPLSYDPLHGFLSMWPRNESWQLRKTIGFRPNRLMGFLNTPYSLHGHAPFVLKGRRLSINVTMKYTDAHIRTMYARLPPTYREVFVKPKILGAILDGVDTVAERARDPEGAFAFLNG